MLGLKSRVTHAIGAIVILALTGKAPALTGAFSPYVPQPLPQRASGDFDGDGRSDLAVIQDDSNSRHLSIRFSGSPDAIDLETTVAGVIQGDIDQDGDLDLVAVTPSSDVLVWINDGHGHFTRQETSQTPGLCDGPVWNDSASSPAIALGTTVPAVAADNRAETRVVVTDSRPPGAPEPFDFAFLLLPCLRAPPLAFTLT